MSAENPLRSRFRVAICGAGIGGLVLALVLRNSACSVELYESGNEITTVGAGITLFVRASEIMQHLGLLDELAGLAINPPLPNSGPRFRKGDQVGDNAWFEKILQIGPLHLHRRDLVDVLLRHIPSTTAIHISKKLISWSQNTPGPILMQFADGTSAEADVLIGADGIWSITRRCMYEAMAKKDEGAAEVLSPFQRFIDPLWTGIFAYRSLIPVEKLGGTHFEAAEGKVLTYYLGRGQHLVTYPISQGRLLNVIVYVHVPDAYDTPSTPGQWVINVGPGEKEELVKRFADWDPEVQMIVRALENPTRWALHIVRKLPHFVSGSTALLGDAAHAMEPHFGAGAAQAIEDAFILGHLLAHELVSKDNIETALHIFESIRQPFSQNIVQKSQNFGRLLAFKSPANDGTYLPHESVADLDQIKRIIQEEWEWQNKGGTLQEWEDAKRKLEEILA